MIEILLAMCVFGIKVLFYQDNDYRNFTETVI